MKYKAGQLVLLTRASSAWAKPYIGSIRTLRKPSDVWNDCWLLEPPVKSCNGEVCWHEIGMRPINTPKNKNETLKWEAVPKGKVKA